MNAIRFSSSIVPSKIHSVRLSGAARFAMGLFFIFISMPLVWAAGPPGGGGGVSWAEVLHDSRSEFYRSPGWATTWPFRTGAVPVGETVTLRIRAKAGNLSGAVIRVWDNDASKEVLVTMSLSGSDSLYDYWEGALSFNKPVDVYYAFRLTAGSDVDWYGDDGKQDGGAGEMTDDQVFQNDYSIVWHDSNFTTPAWHMNSIIYQIMVDGFYNGEVLNDPEGNGSQGDVTWWEWDSDGDGRFTQRDSKRLWANKKTWGEERANGYDFYGGDFQGVRMKINYLTDLGISAIYFNPWMESPDYHGYAVSDYKSVHPYYGAIGSVIQHDSKTSVVINNSAGSLSVFDEARSDLNLSGIRVIGDIVLNHAGAQSRYFQRFEHVSPDWGIYDYYPTEDGAYEFQSSPWMSWFNFSNWNHGYQSWWGFNNLPEIIYVRDGIATSALTDLVSGPDSVFDFWHAHGVEGFRLDVNGDFEDEANSRFVNKEIRKKVKTNNPEAVVIAEIWGDTSPWLSGDMCDGTMNYRFRGAVIDWVKDTTTLTTANFDQRLLVIQEDYPVPAQYANWAILGSHDTQRIRTVLGSEAKQKLAAVLQFTHVGPPVIWYGDEIGMTGGDDPKNRTSMDWNAVSGNTTLAFYKSLISIRSSYPELREGWITTLHLGGDVYAYGREIGTGTSSARDAVVAVNRSTSNQSISIDVRSLPELSAGETLTDRLTGISYTVSSTLEIAVTVPGQGAVILTQ